MTQQQDDTEAVAKALAGPFHMSHRPRDGGIYSNVSLRDYFAARALSAINYANILAFAETSEECELQILNVAALSYRLADAMLKAREQP